MSNRVSWLQSACLGIAGNAPTYSIAIATSALIGAVSGLAPLALLVCGLVVLGIVFAYMKLNAEQASCGAAYFWAGKIIHPLAGFFAGWCLLLASALFMVSAILPASKATLLLIAPTLLENEPLITLIAVAWLSLLTWTAARGIELIGKLQPILTALEVVLIVLMATALIKQYGWALLHPLRNLSFDALDTASLAEGIVIALFFYWGWDVIFNLSEETQSSSVATAQASLLAITVLMVIFVFFSLAIATGLSGEAISASGDNAIFALVDKLLPTPYKYIAMLAFLLSVLGAIETSLIQFSRTLLAKSRDGILHNCFARVHPHWHTPINAIALNFIIVLIILLFSVTFSHIEAAVIAAVEASGVLVAYYYGATGIACALYYYRKGISGIKNRLLYIYWPLASVTVFFIVATLSQTAMHFSWIATIIIVAGLAIGAVLAYQSREKLAQLIETSSIKVSA